MMGEPSHHAMCFLATHYLYLSRAQRAEASGLEDKNLRENLLFGSFLAKQSDQKQLEKERVYLILYFQLTIQMKSEQEPKGRNQQAEPGANKECCSLPCSLWLTLRQFLILPRRNCPQWNGSISCQSTIKAISCQSTIKAISHRHGHRPI